VCMQLLSPIAERCHPSPRSAIGACDSAPARAIQLGKREWLPLNDGHRATRGDGQGKQFPKHAGPELFASLTAVAGTLLMRSQRSEPYEMGRQQQHHYRSECGATGVTRSGDVQCS
jgi:hypothetical protein